MTTGISGDTAVAIGSANPLSSEQLMVIELRVLSQLIQNTLGINVEADELRQMRNDAAFDLGIFTPVPGT